jgi:uncharacterized protein
MMKRPTFMRRMNATCAIQAAVLILALVLAGPVIAGPWEDAKVAYDQQDYAAAVRILKPIADQGDPFAQNNIGSAYQNGRGVPQDYVLAMQWYRKAADQGKALAQYNLGGMYDQGRGVPQDFVLAAKWYRKAADQGNASAQTNLGAMYGLGQGVPVDYVLSYMWANLAAAGGDENARKNRDLDATQMTQAQIGEAQRLTREWKPK